MKTLSAILPNLPKATAKRYARVLAEAGLVRPVTQGEGAAFLYDESDEGRLAEFARLQRNERLSAGKAMERISGSGRIEAARMPGSRQPGPDLREEVARLRREGEEREREAREERRNAIARIGLLERERRAPAGLWARFLLAVDVLLGRAAAVPALPAGETRKAA